MTVCETTDFLYPMKADIFYPIVDQGPYGNVVKTWVFNKTVACNFSIIGNTEKEEIKPNVKIDEKSLLVGRTRTDIRIESETSQVSITNVLITNIRTASDQSIYIETSGPRAGRSTLYEVATLDPILGPFNSIDYYKLVIRRSQNQATDL